MRPKTTKTVSGVRLESPVACGKGCRSNDLRPFFVDKKLNISTWILLNKVFDFPFIKFNIKRILTDRV